MADELVPDPSIQQRIADLTDDERLVLAKVADIVRKIQYGTVVLVIQDGKVVQIEMAEKFRLR
ncbi:MAG: YezD family protein [Actinomycetota bacterium]